MKILLILISIATLLSCSTKKSDKTVVVSSNDWKTYFDSANLDGTFVLTELNSDTIKVYNAKRSAKAYLPASTYKILNSLISLETNAIEDENEIIKWDGKKRFYDKWNQDQNLKSAIKYSCVWFYQELARRVGRERMQSYLDTTHYGNSKIGKDIDKFWLEGNLRISANEQIDFITNFVNSDLPFSKMNMEIVKDILRVDSTDNYQLYAKTGWTARVESGKQIGWYVGFVENKNETWVFAINIDIGESEDSKNREGIAREILKSEGLIN